jgi:SAM-dependent methyltransferase
VETTNCYEDSRRAEAYSKLEFPGTYYLAFRDLPQILRQHVAGRRALDFGCGAGRSTRFLQKLGFEAVGIDVSADMIRRAREIDPRGDYRLIADGDTAPLAPGAYDVVLSAFTFDNIPNDAARMRIFQRLRDLLVPGGCIVSIVSSPEIYRHEWASFSTRNFPENQHARNGDRVRIVITDIEDSRPVEDVVCTEEAYLQIFRSARLELAAEHRPLGREEEPFPWVNETRIAPWVIHVLQRSVSRSPAR